MRDRTQLSSLPCDRRLQRSLRERRVLSPPMWRSPITRIPPRVTRTARRSHRRNPRLHRRPRATIQTRAKRRPSRLRPRSSRRPSSHHHHPRRSRYLRLLRSHSRPKNLRPLRSQPKLRKNRLLRHRHRPRTKTKSQKRTRRSHQKTRKSTRISTDRFYSLIGMAPSSRGRFGPIEMRLAIVCPCAGGLARVRSAYAYNELR